MEELKNCEELWRKNGRMEECKNVRMKEWRNRLIHEWTNRGIEECRIEKWKNGKIVMN